MLINNTPSDIQRRELFRLYMQEINEMLGEEFEQNECDNCFYTYLRRTFIEWYDIYFGTKLVGFFVIGKKPECHPDADRFIMQTYIKPEYRRKGLASAVISEYITNNPGTYVLDIIKTNELARTFWFKTFYINGYHSIVLRPVKHGVGTEVKTYAWQKGKTL